jgi:anti-sigma regulatory factor (Ser/Thr protein kinase)
MGGKGSEEDLGMMMPTDPAPDAVGQASDHSAVLQLVSDPDGAVVQLRVRGCWDWRVFLEVRAAVLKCLVEHPAAMILDLRGLQDPTASSAALWFAMRRAAEAMRPPVRIVLCVQQQTPLAVRLRRLGTTRVLPVFATVSQARAAVAAGLALPEQLQRTLPASSEAVNDAAALAADACRAWSLPRLSYSARLLITELVSNAVRHAGTEVVVTVARRDQGLFLAVRDGSMALPRGLTVAGLAAGRPQCGHGLQMVDALATAWGAQRTDDGTGKVVWATLHLRQPTRVALEDQGWALAEPKEISPPLAAG